MKKLITKNFELPNRYVLAPMAGYTDFSYRKICSKYNSSLLYTEMISSTALVYNSKETYSMLEETKKDGSYKVALQLFGGNLEHMVKAIKICEENAKYDFLDINLGCSVNKVLKQHAGAYFLDHKEELETYITEIVKASSKPVFVKTRIGPSDSDITIYENLKIFERAGVSLIALHARSRKALYTGLPHYDVIKKVKESTDIPILANGNISLDNAFDVLSYTNSDGIMIGRETLGNPKIFKNLILKEENKELDLPTLESQIYDLIEHINYMSKVKNEHAMCNILKSIAPSYFKNFKNSKQIRIKLMSCSSKKDYLSFLEELLNNKNI